MFAGARRWSPLTSCSLGTWAKFQVVTYVNVDVASLHADSVAETVDNVRKQQELTETSTETAVLTDGVLAATWKER
jgi:hypothetical protein